MKIIRSIPVGDRSRSLACVAARAAEPDSSIKIDAGKVLNHVSPLMYGSCIEDVNHEIYGGLYAQMIFGESFEEPPREPGPGVSGMWDTAGHRRGDRAIHLRSRQAVQFGPLAKDRTRARRRDGRHRQPRAESLGTDVSRRPHVFRPTLSAAGAGMKGQVSRRSAKRRRKADVRASRVSARSATTGSDSSSR